MPLEVNIENTTFTKQVYDEGVRFALNQFAHSIGYVMGRNGIFLGGRHLKELYLLSPREMSDLNVLLHDGDKAAVVAFLDGPRDATPRGSKGRDPIEVETDA